MTRLDETAALPKSRSETRPWRTRAATWLPAKAGWWIWLPALSLVPALGLLLISLANALSRSSLGQGELLFWAGLIMVVVPFAVRLASAEPTRIERVGLLCVFGLALYAVKVMHSPFAFTFSDELSHLYNVIAIQRTDALFSENPILPVTSLYPGLETVTATLAQLGNWDLFSAGLAVGVAARLIMQLALFLLYERLSGSSRVAGLATLLYAGNPNFLFWAAQFSYESLALPLSIVVLYVVVYRDQSRDRALSVGLTVLAVVSIGAVVATHHLTSYFLAAWLLLWALFQTEGHRLALDLFRDTIDWYGSGMSARQLGRAVRQSMARYWRRLLEARKTPEGRVRLAKAAGAGGLAVLSLAMALAWLNLIASQTIPYLEYPLTRAAISIVQIITGEETSRQLFVSTAGNVAPLWERSTGILSVLLPLLGLPFGLRAVWQRYRKNYAVLVMALAAVGYFGMVALRLSPAAWESGNRASEFLFVGLALVLALGALELWSGRWAGRLSRGLVTACVAVIFVGGAIAGWSPDIRLSRPFVVTAEGHVLEPPGLAAARWSLANLSQGNNMAADVSNAAYQLDFGGQFAMTGATHAIREMLQDNMVRSWEVQSLQDFKISYVVMDRRQISWNNMQGLYFDQTATGDLPATALLDAAVYLKFDGRPDVNRLLDAGNLVLYDVRSIRETP